MTELGEVLDGPTRKRGGLREEIARAVMAINPTTFDTNHYQYWEVDKVGDPPEGTKRAFRIMFAFPTDAGLGSSVKTRSLIEARIAVWYPASEEWAIAAREDYAAIRRKLLSDQTFSSSDICQRFVDNLAGPDEDQTENGVWVTTPIRCIVEHD